MMTEQALKVAILKHVAEGEEQMQRIAKAELSDYKELAEALIQCRMHITRAEEFTYELINMAPLRAKELKRKGLDRETGLDTKRKK